MGTLFELQKTYLNKEGSLRIHDYYQSPPRRSRRESCRAKATLLSWENVEIYLNLEMKVEQLFTYHQVSEERKVPLTTLSFQNYAMYWWTSLERDKHPHNEPPILYWNDLESAMRQHHVPSYYNQSLWISSKDSIRKI